MSAVVRERAPRPSASRRGTRLAVVAVLVAHAVLVLWTLFHTSATSDEVGHVPSGLSYVEKRTFEVNPQPPLVKGLGALVAKAAGARGAYDGEWRAAREAGGSIHYPAFALDFMRANQEPPGHYHRVLWAARTVVLPFSLLLGAALFWWGRDLFGAWGGLAVLCLWCFSPNAIAHAALFTSDVPSAALMLVATYAFWRWLRRPGLAGAAGVGALLGLAQLVKFTALLLFALWPLLALPLLLRRPGPGSPLPGAAGARLAFLGSRGLLIVAVALGVLNAGYGFRGTGHPLGGPDYISPQLTEYRHPPRDTHPRHVYRQAYANRVNRFRDTPLASLPVPLPEPYLVGFDLQAFEANTDLPGWGWIVYLRGEVQRGGWWYYYFYALLVKSTPGLLLLLAASLGALALSPRSRLDPADELFVWGPAVAMLGSLTLTDVDIGVRYALPCLPFLMLGTGRLVRLVDVRPVAILAGAGLLVHVASGIWIAPHALAYFSPLAGGPDRGYRHLTGSNLDWGQELLHLHRWLAERGADGPVSAALYSRLDPAVVGLDVRLVPRDPRALRAAGGPPREPDEPLHLGPGRYVVSANFVAGIPSRLVLGERVVPVPADAYAYFEKIAPVARIGHVLWVYELDVEDAERLNRSVGFPRRAPPTSQDAR